MIWRISDRADPAALPLADRHYNRQKPGTPQFVPPGRCLVLLEKQAPPRALWALQLLPDRMPSPEPPRFAQLSMAF